MAIFPWFVQLCVFEVMDRNTRCMCIIIVHNIICRPATQYVRPLFLISPFFTIVADVSSHFSKENSLRSTIKNIKYSYKTQNENIVSYSYFITIIIVNVIIF